MFHVEQFKQAVIIDSLQAIDEITPPLSRRLCSDAAVNLLLGTCAQESGFGTYITQLGGPALGVYQMEPDTYYDIVNNYLGYRPILGNRLLYACDYVSAPHATALIYNLRLSTLLARVHFLRVQEPLPEAKDIEGLAKYWKRYYNTMDGRGTIGEFIKHYQFFIRGH